MNEIVIAIIGSGALSALVSAIFNHIEKRHDKNDAINLLLYHDLKTECKEYIALGHIDGDSLEVLTKMHSVYHKRGGNGYLDKLMDEVNKLPIKD